MESISIRDLVVVCCLQLGLTRCTCVLPYCQLSAEIAIENVKSFQFEKEKKLKT